MSLRPTVVLVGPYDLARYDQLVVPLIAAQELGRRNGAIVRPFTPFGRPVTDVPGSAGSWALGPWSEDRAAEVAAHADLVVVDGRVSAERPEVIARAYDVRSADASDGHRWLVDGPHRSDVPSVYCHPRQAPTAIETERWRGLLDAHRLVVGDETSRSLLDELVPPDRLRVVPDSALVAHRLLTDEQREAAVAALRGSGKLPAAGPFVVVHGVAGMAEHADALVSELTSAVDGIPIVTLCLDDSARDEVFAAAFRDASGRHVYRVGPGASVEARLATIASSSLYVGSSLRGAMTAFGQGRPAVVLDGDASGPTVESLASALGWSERAVSSSGEIIRRTRDAGVDESLRLAKIRAVDEHFDELADLAMAAAAARGTPRRVPRSRDLAVRQWRRLDTVPRALPPCALADSLLDHDDQRDTAAPDEDEEVAGLRRRSVELRRLREQVDFHGLATAVGLEVVATVREALAEAERVAADRAGAIEHLEAVVASLREDASRIEATAADRAGAIEHLEGVVMGLRSELAETVERHAAADAELAALRDRGLFRRIVPPKS